MAIWTDHTEPKSLLTTIPPQQTANSWPYQTSMSSSQNSYYNSTVSDLQIIVNKFACNKESIDVYVDGEVLAIVKVHCFFNPLPTNDTCACTKYPLLLSARIWVIVEVNTIFYCFRPLLVGISCRIWVSTSLGHFSITAMVGKGLTFPRSHQMGVSDQWLC